MKDENLMKIVFIAIALGILYYVYKNQENHEYLQSNVIFTVGKATEYSGTGGAKRFVSYIYYIEGKKHNGGVARNYDMVAPLDKYYRIKYSKTKNEISEMNLNEEVTDSVLIVNAGFKYR
jgi:hypothetical protein